MSRAKEGLVQAIGVPTLTSRGSRTRQGDPGDAYYIVFSGEVGIYIRQQDDSPSDTPPAKRSTCACSTPSAGRGGGGTAGGAAGGFRGLRRSSGVLQRAVQATVVSIAHDKETAEKTVAGARDKKTNDVLKRLAAFGDKSAAEGPRTQADETDDFGVKVATCYAGKGFGELALISAAKRAATAVCPCQYASRADSRPRGTAAMSGGLPKGPPHVLVSLLLGGYTRIPFALTTGSPPPHPSSQLIVIRRSDYEKLVKAELIAELKKKQQVLHRAVPSSKLMSKVLAPPGLTAWRSRVASVACRARSRLPPTLTLSD